MKDHEMETVNIQDDNVKICKRRQFWNAMDLDKYRLLRNASLNINSYFASTFCECLFSTIKHIKPKNGSKLMAFHLHGCLWAAIPSHIPDYDVLADQL